MPWVDFKTEFIDRHSTSEPPIYVAEVPNPEDKPVKDIRDRFGSSIRAEGISYASSSVLLVFSEPREGEVAL